MELETELEIGKMNLYQVVAKRVKERSGKVALQFEKKTWSWQTLIGQIDSLAANLHARGVSGGCRFGICLPNSPQLVITVYALNKIGATAVLLNPLEVPETLAAQLEAARCNWLLFSEITAEKLPQVFAHSPGLKDRLCLFSSSLLSLFPQPTRTAAKYKYRPAAGLAALSKECSVTAFEPLLRIPPAKGVFHPFVGGLADCRTDQAVILFSGGSTGPPKPVIHSSYAVNSAARRCMLIEEELEEDSCIFGLLPFFHVFGLVVAMHITLSTGARLILFPYFRPMQVARCFLREKPAYFPGVPTIFVKLLETGILQKAAARGRLDTTQYRRSFCGGDSLDSSVRDEWNLLMAQGGSRGALVEGYGMTECCPVCVNREKAYPADSLGLPFEGLTVGIFVPHQTNRVPIREKGEICVCGSSLFSGYDGDEQVTGATLRMHPDGRLWLHTGDTGWMDGEGRLYFSCRSRQIAKVSGHTVFLRRIEEVVKGHVMIADAAAIARSDPEKGSVVELHVALSPKASGVSGQEVQRQLQRFYRQHFNPWERPRKTEICATGALPKTALGKISYADLDAQGDAR